MKYVAGLFAVVLLVAGATVLAYNRLQDEIETKSGGGGESVVVETSTTITKVPQADQVIVRGTAQKVHLEGARPKGSLALPLTITTPERGVGGATITHVTVDGTLTDVDWDAGAPLVLDGDGGILTSPVGVDVDPASATVAFGTLAHGLAPGSYTVTGSVGIGTGGVARPADRAAFTAGDGSSIQLRGDAVTTFDLRAMGWTGPGRIVVEGDLTVVHPDGSSTPARSVTLDSGPFEVQLGRADGGISVEATLQGQVTTA